MWAWIVGVAAANPEPVDGAGWWERGFAHVEEGALTEAAAAFRQSEALGYRPAVSRYNVACALARAGRPDEALEALRGAVALGFADLDWIHADPDLASLTPLPGFPAAVARLEVLDVLRIATGRDGLWATAASLRARLDAACAAGDPTACALDGVDVRNRGAIGERLAPLCAQGSEGSAVACLGAAWTMLDPSATGAFPGRPDDVGAFVEAVRSACEGGVARGCTELGYAWDLGMVRYPNRREALSLWFRACAAEELRACTAAAEAGIEGVADPRDLLWMLSAPDPEDPTATHPLEQACLAGSSVGCSKLAARKGALPEPALVATRAACAEGDVAACALDAQLGLVAGAVSQEEALARLDAACPILPGACEEATFLRQGAPPVAGYPDPPPMAKDVQRGMFDLRADLHQCLLGAIHRDPSAEGWIDAALRLDPEGKVVGVHVPAPLDELHRACVVDVLRTTRIRPGGPNPARVEVSLPAFVGVTAKVAPTTSAGDGGREAALVAKDAAAWGPLNRCAAERGLVGPDLDVVVELVVHRDRRISDVRMVGGLDEPEIERCIVDWLGARRLAERPALATPLRATIRLFQRAEGERPAEEAPSFTVAADDDGGPPVVVKMLVLTVERSRVGKRKGRLTARSVRSIETAHREMAEAVERMTHGRVRIELTTVSVPARIDIEDATEADGLARYQILPQDLPLSAWALMSPGEYDSVMLWGPVPLGFPHPRLGVTYGGVLLAGATASSGAIPSRRELRSNRGVPAWELPLHEWWHQVEGRARAWLDLRTDWPPRNHAVLWVGGRRLDPRTWIDETNETTIPWYEHVLGSMPRAFWADVWGRGERIGRDPANLALEAYPIGIGVDHTAGLADTVVSFGRYARPVTEAGAEAPWFGLLWPASRRIGRLVVHVGGFDGAAWADATLAVGTDGDWDTRPWSPLPAQVVKDGDRWTFTFPPTELRRLRIRPVGEGRLECREIEAYAE